MPADINSDEDVDRNDDLSTANDDDTDAIIRNALRKQTANLPDDDDDVFSAPEMVESNVVAAEAGQDLVEQARQNNRAAKTDDDAKSDEKPAVKVEDQPAAKPEGQADAKPDDAAKAPSEIDALLADVPEAKRGAIADRLRGADEVMSLFADRGDELKMHGVSAKEAMSNLLQINAYAQAEPDKYLAWAAHQIAQGQDGKSAADVLGAAAAHHGYKLVPVDGEADEFEDEATKRLREENRALRAAKGLDFGPDKISPEVQARTVETQLSAWQQGKADLDVLGPAVAQKATEHAKATGKPVTIHDLDRFYDEARGDVAKRFGTAPAAANPTLAAQPAPAVAQGGADKKAARLDKSIAASKSLDGSGQGANRPPAQADNQSLRDLVASQVRKHTT